MTPEFWHGRRVLVTGHTGFKGAWLTLWLEALGAEVTGFAQSPETEPSLFSVLGPTGIHSVIGDIRNPEEVARCVQEARPDVVLHLAAQSLVRRSYRLPLETYAVNVMGTANVLDAVRQSDSVMAAVVVTSDKCYENRGWEWGYREIEPMGGHDPYSSSKGCAELVTAAFRSSYFGVGRHPARLATARAGNVIGGGDWSEDRLVPDVVRSFLAGEAVQIRNPLATRPWQHVLEPLSGYLLLAERLCGADGMAYAEGWNFGPADQDCRPVGEVVDHLATLWGDGAAWCLAAGEHPHEAHLLKVDASKAQARLGWRPKVRLGEALDWTGAWYRDQASGSDARALTAAQIARYEALSAAD